MREKMRNTNEKRGEGKWWINNGENVKIERLPRQSWIRRIIGLYGQNWVTEKETDQYSPTETIINSSSRCDIFKHEFLFKGIKFILLKSCKECTKSLSNSNQLFIKNK